MKFVLLFTVLTWQMLASAAINDVINRGNGAEPDSLNPHLAQGLNSMNVLLDMYEGLMTFDVHGEPTYGVAISHTVNDDHTQWQFNLNPAAKWSDGRVVTASDFINSWQLAYAPATAAPYRQVMDNLVHNNQLQVSSDNPHHLKLQLNQADSGLLSKLVLPIFLPTRLSNDGQFISNGAYQLKEWHTQERITLSKNPYFHAVNEVSATTINYWVTENQNSELLRFRAGELDITETIPDNKITWLREHLPDALRIAPYYGTFFLGLNLNDKHLSDPHLRVALSASIDRQILVDKVLKTGQMPAHTIIPKEQDSGKGHGFDLERAKAALLKSHFKPKTDRLEILYNSSNNQKKVALAVAAMWRQNLGIRSQLRNQEWKVFVNTRKTANKQVFRSGWIADYYDPMNFLELFHSQSNFNFYAFNHQPYDGIIDQLRRSNTNKINLINQAEQIIKQEIPVIPLYHYVSRHLVNPQISGFVDNQMDRHLSRYLSKQQ